jgi:hypothetical protein
MNGKNSKALSNLNAASKTFISHRFHPETAAAGRHQRPVTVK